MRLIGSFQTITTQGRSSCQASSGEGCSSSTSAGAMSVLMPGLWRRSAGETDDLHVALVPGRIDRADPDEMATGSNPKT